MSFNKSELQTLRHLLTQEILKTQVRISIDDLRRKTYFDAASKDDPVNTKYQYLHAKSASNRLKSSRKKLQKQEALLKKLKQEMQQGDSYTTVIDIDIDLTGGIIERFFDFVRGK